MWFVLYFGKVELKKETISDKGLRTVDTYDHQYTIYRDLQ
jgi:hypothetical protein